MLPVQVLQFPPVFLGYVLLIALMLENDPIGQDGLFLAVWNSGLKSSECKHFPPLRTLLARGDFPVNICALIFQLLMNFSSILNFSSHLPASVSDIPKGRVAGVCLGEILSGNDPLP